MPPAAAREASGPALAALAVLAVFVQGFGIWSLTALTAVAGSIVAVGVWRVRAVPVALRADPLAVLVAALAAWLVVCAQLSPAAGPARLAVYQPLLLPLAYAAFALAPDPEAAWRWVCRGMIALAMLLALLVVVQAVITVRPDFSALFVQRNSLGGYLLLTALLLAPAVVSPARSAPARRRRRWHALAVFLGLFVVSLSASRGAIGAMIVATSGFCLWLPRDVRVRGGRLLVALALWAFLLADLAVKGDVFESMASVGSVPGEVLLPGFSALVGGDVRHIRQVARDSKLHRGSSKLASANERVLIWSATLALLRDAPWHGFGPGTFRLVYPAYALPEDTSSMSYAHNDFLQAAAELGVPGALLVVALGAVVAARGLRARAGTRAGDVQVAALFWGIAATALHSLLSYNFHVPATLILFGFALARFAARTRPEAVSEPAVTPWWRQRMGAGWLAGLLAAGVLALTAPLVAAGLMARDYDEGIDSLAAGRLEEAADALGRAAVLSPNARVAVAQAHVYLAAFEASGRREFLEDAGARVRAAEALDPFSPEVAHARMLLALSLDGLEPGRHGHAVRNAYVETLRRDPRYVPARVDLAKTLLERGESAAAHDVLEEGLRYRIADQPLLLDYLAMLEALRRAAGDERGAQEAALERRSLEARLAKRAEAGR